MEIEENTKILLKTAPETLLTNNATLAPIAEPEFLPPHEKSLDFSSQHPEKIMPTNEKQLPKKNIGLIRLRRKRRQDPFGNLIMSTKKMKINDAQQEFGAQGRDECSSMNIQQSSVECDDNDGFVFYYGGEDDDSTSEYDEDSNAEDFYKNDYPDEEANEFENETTSEDDYFDHYGDENIKYRHYCYDQNYSDEEPDDIE